VPLRKPSEFFNDISSKNSLDVVNEELNSAAPEKIEKLTEAFDVFKYNLSNIQSLTEFTNNIDGFKSSIERIDDLSQGIDLLKEEIDSCIKREDLDNAMVSQLFFVEESIKNVQNNIKYLNSKTLLDIKEEFTALSETIEDFLSVEAPKIKSSVSQSEIRIDERFLDYKKSLDLEVERIDDEISQKLLSITETVHGLNQNSLFEIKENISSIEDKLDYTLKKELPKYKKFFAETESKTEKRLSESKNYIETLHKEIESNHQSRINDIKEQLDNFINLEIPKYRNILVESSLKNENDIKRLTENIENNILKVNQTVLDLEKKVNLEKDTIDETLNSKISEIESFISESKNQISSISNTYENLYKDFKNREISENKKLEKYSDRLDIFSEKITNLEENLTKDVSDLQSNLDISTTKYYDILKNEVGYFEQNILDKVKDLEINFVRNEKHIQDAKDTLKETLSKIKIDDIEKKNNQLLEKISHLESILEKFDEKKLLTEDLTDPPSTKNSDPLTPLNKDYVTLKDLQDHYRIFINRVQMQLASIGGGGAGFVKDLADVSFDESTGQNKLLIFNGTNWVGIASTALSGGGGSSTLVGLSDVDSTNLGDGRFLRYNASTSEFTFAPVSASNLELIAGDIQSGILTTSGLGPAVVMSISASTYRSVNYQVQVTEGTNYNMTTINVIHDGTTTYMTEYGTINQPIGVATFSTDISGGALRLLGHPAFASDTTFKVVFTAIES
jgi:hypothetical protein